MILCDRQKKWQGKGDSSEMVRDIQDSARKPWRKAYAAASVRLAVPVLVRILRTCVATVLGLMYSPSAISRLLLPAARRRSTSTSRWDRSSREEGAAGGSGV